MSKVIILTGASRGIGLSIAHFLLKASHKLVVIARTPEPLEALKKSYPGQVAVLAADLSDFTTAKTATTLALTTFSRIDSLILNHGILDAVDRVASTTAEDWRRVFDVNFFSCVAFAQAALPSLRQTKGRIIMISSGAAANGYSTWGAYGASKAAMNHLAMTLATEEPDVTTLAIRPGVVDTGMQVDIREKYNEVMDEKDRKKFAELKSEGKLLRPEQPGNVVARLAVSSDEDGKGLNGKFFSWNDKELAAFQDA